MLEVCLELFHKWRYISMKFLKIKYGNLRENNMNFMKIWQSELSRKIVKKDIIQKNTDVHTSVECHLHFR